MSAIPSLPGDKRTSGERLKMTRVTQSGYRCGHSNDGRRTGLVTIHCSWNVQCQIRFPRRRRTTPKRPNSAVRCPKWTLSISVHSGNRRLCRTLRQAVLRSLPVLLLLSGCDGAEPECDSLDTRSSVIKIVSDDSNNALVDYAAKNSSVVEARANSASTEAEKLTILQKARQGASYRLGDTISTNSKSKDKRTVTCSGELSATVEDATAQKQVDFKVEQAPDGKVSVSVSPFQF